MAQPLFLLCPTDMVHAQLCSEWPWLRYWSHVQIFCYHQINSLRQNLYNFVRFHFTKMACFKYGGHITYGYKSHIGLKKCFTPKYREKCIYFFLTEHTLYHEHLTHIKVYIF